MSRLASVFHCILGLLDAILLPLSPTGVVRRSGLDHGNRLVPGGNMHRTFAGFTLVRKSGCDLREGCSALVNSGEREEGGEPMGTAPADQTAGTWRKQERDIDLMLAEEFSVSPQFATWFLGRTSKFGGTDAHAVDVRVSVSDNLGESDLVVLFERPMTEKFALFIEDKINAPLQPEQETRYRMRARTGVERGHFSDFEIVLCAPAGYIAHLERPELFDSHVSYESIAEFLKNISAGDERLMYRVRFLESAILPSTRTWQREQDDLTDRFWEVAYQIAHREFRELEMKPLRLTKNSTWSNFRTSDMPTMP